MTKPNCRRSIRRVVATGAILLLTALFATAQTEDPTRIVRLARTISTAYALPGSVFRVTIQIEPLQDLDGVGVSETLPLGWTVHPVETEGAAFKRSENEWVFPETLAQGSTHQLIYEVTVPAADRLYADPLPSCFEISGTFQTTVPGGEIPILGDGAVEIVTALPIPTAVAHLIPATSKEADRIDLRLDRLIHAGQLDRSLKWWATDSVVPWTEGEIIDLPMMERLAALFETCTEADALLPLSVNPELVAVRTINSFLPCDSVLLPEGCLDPGLPARKFEVTIKVTSSHDVYSVGLTEWFPESWRVTPLECPGFTYRPSRTEWIYPGRVRNGETIVVSFLVEVITSTTDRLDTDAGCCGANKPLDGIVSSGLECSERPIIGESAIYVWRCLPVLLAIARWGVDEDRLNAALSDHITFPQVQRAVEFWLSGTPVPHTCGYSVGYHMLKRIVAHWLAGIPVTEGLPGDVPAACGDENECYIATCPDGGGLCHLSDLQSPEDYVGLPEPPRISIDIEGSRDLTCAAPTTTLRAVAKGGTPPHRYEWRGPGGELLGTMDRIEIDAPGVYAVTVVSVGGCRVSVQAKITQNVEAPQVSINVEGTLNCVVDYVELAASILGGRPPFEVRWYGASGELLGEGVRLVVTKPEIVKAVAVGANGCTGHAEAVVLEDLQAPAVDAGPDQVLTCRESVVTLAGFAAEGRSPYSYTWTNPDGTIL
ncbi:hypothetical protein ACFLS0_03450, partial [Candidatus Bipolaricaulota bacterium]